MNKYNKGSRPRQDGHRSKFKSQNSKVGHNTATRRGRPVADPRAGSTDEREHRPAPVHGQIWKKREEQFKDEGYGAELSHARPQSEPWKDSRKSEFKSQKSKVGHHAEIRGGEPGRRFNKSRPGGWQDGRKSEFKSQKSKVEHREDILRGGPAGHPQAEREDSEFHTRTYGHDRSYSEQRRVHSELRTPASEQGRPHSDVRHPTSDLGRGMKLQQLIAHSGLSSRRKAVEFIEQGRVYVNGARVTDVTARVNPDKDYVKVDGRLIHAEKKVYIVMNKPEGCVTTVSDDQGRKTVLDVLGQAVQQRIYPVGRLDFNTTGCLILTNDGDLANRIMHPKFEVLKRYEAKITGRLAPETAARLKRGVKYEGVFYRAVDAGVYHRGEANDQIFVVIKEGMNHQVRLMLKAVGAPPVWLHRASVGPVNVKKLEYGQWRWMTQDEIDYFRRG